MVVKQIWRIGERKFKDDFNRSMMVFDYLVVEIMLYGFELFGWRERSEFGRIQQNMVFGFRKMHSKIYNIISNKKRILELNKGREQ